MLHLEQIPEEIKNFIGNKNIQSTIFRIQGYDSVMCRYFHFGFISFTLKGKKLADSTNLFHQVISIKEWLHNFRNGWST